MFGRKKGRKSGKLQTPNCPTCGRWMSKRQRVILPFRIVRTSWFCKNCDKGR